MSAPAVPGRSVFARLGRALHLGLTWAGMLALVVLLASTGLGVVGRYFHIQGVTWSFEMLSIMFLWIIAVGTVLAEVSGENVSVDGTSSDRGPLFRTYHAVVLLLVSAALIRSGYAMLGRTGYMPTPVMRIPSWTMQGIVIFMGVCLGVIALLRLFRILR